MSFLVLVVDDEPDVEMLFRQQFRRTCATTASGWILLSQRPALFNVSRGRIIDSDPV
jgi:hypothetical protein